MNIIWSCENCKRKEKTSPSVVEMFHIHGKDKIPLSPYKKPRKSPGTITLKSLKSDVWDLFSEYIRRSSADENGYCECITCGRRDHWKKMQAGHYISRKHNSILLDERNVHPQCPLCNGYGHGMEVAYKAFIIKTYGENIEATLQYLKNQRHTFTVFELTQLKKMYSDKLSNLLVI